MRAPSTPVPTTLPDPMVPYGTNSHLRQLRLLHRLAAQFLLELPLLALDFFELALQFGVCALLEPLPEFLCFLCEAAALALFFFGFFGVELQLVPGCVAYACVADGDGGLVGVVVFVFAVFASPLLLLCSKLICNDGLDSCIS